MPPEPIYRETLRAFLVAAATPIGLWLGFQLQDPTSRLRLMLAEAAERGQALRLQAREAWIRRSVEDLIAATATPAATTTDEGSES